MKINRIVSLTVVVCLLTACIWHKEFLATVHAESTSTVIDFSDTFDGNTLNSEVWYNAKASTGHVNVSDGVLGMKNGYAYTNKIAGVSEWSDYTVETVLSLSDLTENKNRSANIVVYANQYGWLNQSGGYALRLFIDNNNSATLRLYKNNAQVDGQRQEYALGAGENYYVKVSAQTTEEATIIKCYVDNELIFTYEDAEKTYTKGMPGLVVTADMAANFKNFTVKSTSDNVMLYDTFAETAMDSEVWYNANASTGHVNVSDGVLGMKNGYAYTNEIDGVSEWSDYTVETVLSLSDLTENKNRSANIVVYANQYGWLNQSGGYALRLFIDNNNSATLRLYKNNAQVDGQKQEYALEAGENYYVKVSAQSTEEATIIKCYVDNELIFTYEDTEKTYTKGMPGLVVTADMAANFKNFTVTSMVASGDDDTGNDDNTEDDIIFGEGILFSDDFENKSETGNDMWSASRPVESGKMVINNSHAYVSNLDGATEWQDYSVEAELGIYEIKEGKTSGAALMAFCASNTDWYPNYALKLLISVDDAGQVKESSVQLITYQGTKNVILAQKSYSLELGKDYIVKVELVESTIVCYIDEFAVFEYEVEDISVLKGYVGFLASQSKVIVDNVFVKEMDLDSNNDDNTEDDIIFGEGILFSDDFESESTLTERGWNTDKAQILRGTVLLTEGCWNLYLTGLKGSDAWTNYTVSADVLLNGEIAFDPSRSVGVAAIVARTTGSNTGYEFGIVRSPSGTNYVRLYDRTTGTELARNNDVSIELDTVYHLQLVVKDNIIIGYLDGQKVLECTDSTNTVGTIGLRAVAYSGQFDNVEVSSTTDFTTTLSEKSPATGDMNLWPLWMGISIISLALIGLTRRRRYGI